MHLSPRSELWLIMLQTQILLTTYHIWVVNSYIKMRGKRGGAVKNNCKAKLITNKDRKDIQFIKPLIIKSQLKNKKQKQSNK